MRWIPPQYTLVGRHAGVEPGTPSSTGAEDAYTLARTGSARRLEARTAVRVPMVILPAAWTAAWVALCADPLRPLLAVPACP